MIDFFEKLLAERNVRVEIEPHDLARLRSAPPAVFVANHLFNGIDELILLRILAERGDEKSPAAEPLALSPYSNAVPKKIRPLLVRPKNGRLGSRLLDGDFSKILAEKVQKGDSLGLAIDFAGVPLAGWPLENARRALLRRQICRSLRASDAPIVPVRLVADSPAEAFLKSWLPGPLPKIGQPLRVAVRIGRPIWPAESASFERNRDWRAYLRAAIFSLGSPLAAAPFFFFRKKTAAPVPLAEAVSPALLEAEFQALPTDQKLAQRGEFDVFLAKSHQIPMALCEIGRLRELTFRAVGEGTGRAADLDEFDLFYWQLVLWDRKNAAIAGGYRIGDGSEIFEARGPRGFYSSTVFRYEKGFFKVLERGAELGRSFVTPDYQRQRLPLFLLWKGILHFLERRPELGFLFGTVSVSKTFGDVSRGVIVEFIRKNCFAPKLARAVEPRRAFRFRSKKVDPKLLAERLPNIEALEKFVEEIEPSHAAAPVLLRQYIRQNARFAGFCVDPDFADCLDGLMVLDVRDLPASTVENLSQTR